MRVVINGSATDLPLLDESVATVVTSPPYNVGIENKQGLAEYGHDLLPWESYVELANSTATEIERVLIPGGRAWVNIQATVPLDSSSPKQRGRMNLCHIWESALLLAGLSYRDTVVWLQDSHDGGCAWGSWGMPSSPNLRGGHEFVLVYYKPHPDTDGWKRPTPDRWKAW